MYSRQAIYRGTTYRIPFRGYEEVIVPTPPTYTVIPYEAQYRFPYFANNIYRAGIINIPSSTATQMELTHDKVKVINTDYESDTRIYGVRDKFPAPYISRRLKLQAVNGDEELDVFYVMDFNSEPKGTGPLNTGDNYYWDTSTYVLPAVTQTDISEIELAEAGLLNLVNRFPTFDDTGSLENYGMVSLLNILADNIGCAETIMDQHGINKEVIQAYRIDRLPRSWRTKDIRDIYYSISEDDNFKIVNTYGLKNFSKLEFVLYYLCDIYRRLFI